MTTKNILILFSLLTLLPLGCKDKQTFLSRYYLKCDIDGVKYIDLQPAILPPGAAKSPLIYYFLSAELDNYVALSSDIKLESVTNAPQKYSIQFKVPINEPLVIGKKYEVRSIEGEDYLESLGKLLKYTELKIPYVAISAMNTQAAGWCFGNGYVDFSVVDMEKNEAKGRFELLIPSPVASDKGKKLTISGEFFCTIKTDS